MMVSPVLTMVSLRITLARDVDIAMLARIVSVLHAQQIDLGALAVGAEGQSRSHVEVDFHAEGPDIPRRVINAVRRCIYVTDVEVTEI